MHGSIEDLPERIRRDRRADPARFPGRIPARFPGRRARGAAGAP
ncbi:hypothetical protein ACE1SV_55370 [Streptomyces sp. E-15]